MASASKHSIDVDLNKQALSGWYAGATGDTKVLLIHRGQCVGSVPCTLSRPDVAAASFHTTGLCGFSFPAEQHKLQQGNVYKIVIEHGSEQIQALRLYGATVEWQKRFVEHALLPRNDYAYLARATETLFAEECDLIAYKNLLVRLRRGKRGVTFKGKFVGVDYPHKTDDFTYFRFLSETLLPFWLTFLNGRYLWSVLDTFADYGTTAERLGALAVSNYMMAERFLQTRKCVFKSATPYRSPLPQQGYWGGMGTNHLAADDSMEIFLNRNLENLASAPLVRSAFIELMRRSAREQDSALGFNLAYSQYFRETFASYDRNYFN